MTTLLLFFLISFLGASIFDAYAYNFFIILFLFNFRCFKFRFSLVSFSIVLFLFCILSFSFASNPIFDIFMSIRNLFLVFIPLVVSYYSQIYFSRLIFLKFFYFVSFLNLICLFSQHYLGFYPLVFLAPVLDAWSNIGTTLDIRNVGIFAANHRSAFFAAIFFFYCFVNFRSKVLKAISFVVAVYVLNLFAAKTAIVSFVLSILFFVFSSLFNRSSFQSRSILFSNFSFFTIFFSSIFLSFTLFSITFIDQLVYFIQGFFPDARFYNTLAILGNQFLSDYALPFQGLLPSSLVDYSFYLEKSNLHGNEVFLRVLILSYGLPIALLLLYYLFKKSGIFSIFIAVSLLHYSFLFSPFHLLCCLYLNKLYINNFSYDNFHFLRPHLNNSNSS